MPDPDEFHIGDLVEVIGPNFLPSQPWVDHNGVPWMGRIATVVGFVGGIVGHGNIQLDLGNGPNHPFTQWSPVNLRLVESFEIRRYRILGEDFFV